MGLGAASPRALRGQGPESSVLMARSLPQQPRSQQIGEEIVACTPARARVSRREQVGGLAFRLPLPLTAGCVSEFPAASGYGDSCSQLAYARTSVSPGLRMLARACCLWVGAHVGLFSDDADDQGVTGCGPDAQRSLQEPRAQQGERESRGRGYGAGVSTTGQIIL